MLWQPANIVQLWPQVQSARNSGQSGVLTTHLDWLLLELLRTGSRPLVRRQLCCPAPQLPHDILGVSQQELPMARHRQQQLQLLPVYGTISSASRGGWQSLGQVLRHSTVSAVQMLPCHCNSTGLLLLPAAVGTAMSKCRVWLFLTGFKPLDESVTFTAPPDGEAYNNVFIGRGSTSSTSGCAIRNCRYIAPTMRSRAVSCREEGTLVSARCHLRRML